MNSEEKSNSEDVASRIDQEASSSAVGSDSESSNSSDKKDDMKRVAAKKLIEKYFYQLTDGCGNPACDNKYCASSEEFIYKVENLTPNQAAAEAIQLFSQDARLCDRHPNKMPRTHNEKRLLGSMSNRINHKNPVTPSNDIMINNSSNSKNRFKEFKKEKTIPFLTEERLFEILDDCEEHKNYARLIRTLGEIYSSIDSLSRSFLQSDTSPVPDILDRAAGDLSGLKKEVVRSLEGEKDKDEDSCMVSPSSDRGTKSNLPVDLPSVRRAYTALFKLPTSIFENALVNALVTLAGNLQMELTARMNQYSDDDIINTLLIVFEIPALGSGDFLETALPAVCRAASGLSVEMQAKLATAWSEQGRTSIRMILENLHQLVTLRVIVTQFHRDFYVQDENIITSATKLMKVLYYSNVLAGELESAHLRYDDYSSADDPHWGAKQPKNVLPVDLLAQVLGVNILDCRKPYIPFSEFYNEPLSDAVEMDKDFAYFKSELGKFSFMNYAFILTPATKTLGLYFDNRIRMYSERRISFFQSVAGQPSNPYLRLKVRRDHIIDDALVELEMIAMENPLDLKKQLVVEFEGEQGIDEGGVSKEFFQLVIEEIFNPDYAMFTFENDSETAWFNPTSFESDAQFTLIGIVLGLAIYNNIILAVNFPMVVYRKLMGKRGSYEDLLEWNPTIYNSLKQLLEYDEPDIEDVFMQTFRISYQDVFGSIIYHDLKENGDQINVTHQNKHEFVDLYADYMLNKSVEKQFRAFYRGFQMVTDESLLELLFRPEEIELLICGSKNFDFDELEGATEYDGGYTSDTPIIKHFWSVVHSLSMEDKRKLLQFATGSDRVPLGGLSKLKLVIARNGTDSDRLPTAHTCFNVLLLPEYDTKEKLKDRLIKAINYSKGFGML
ncbi:ubiquitin-protein ligase E3A [Agrilus planipennis]|uniref:Ubiquitin-protein ligase E3A n=1 Tax=Agrilus planipennis TaxID=224129 RepID=A0A1W4XIG2_AGRPL|nr:ubiquitin-protein ligase E3A [Agrilus planipennis]